MRLLPSVSAAALALSTRGSPHMRAVVTPCACTRRHCSGLLPLMAASDESGPAPEAPPQKEGDVESPGKSAAERLPREVAAAPEGGGKMLIVFLLLALFTANQWARSLIFYLVDFKAAPTAETAFLFMNVHVGGSHSVCPLLLARAFSAITAPCPARGAGRHRLR